MVEDDIRRELTELLAALVAAPSLSGEEGDVQRTIVAWFEDNGIAVALEPADGGLSNVVVEFDGRAPGPLSGSADTATRSPRPRLQLRSPRPAGSR